MQTTELRELFLPDGDVYRYGVLLVERKKPTDDMFMGVAIRSQINTPRPQCWTRNTQDSQTLI